MASASVSALFVLANEASPSALPSARRFAAGDQNSIVGRLIGMSLSKAEYYRGRAEDCCRNATIAEDVERRLHWLEAAARWVSLARQEGALLPIKVDGSPLSIREVRDAPGSVPMPKRKPRPCTG